MNRACLIGRLCKDLKLNVTPNGIYNTSNTLAVQRQYKNANGEYDSDFINIVVWRNAAEYICKYAKKGSLVSVEGRIQTRTYENNEGKKVYVTEVNAEHVKILDKKHEEKSDDPFADFGNSVELEENFLD